MPSPMLSFRYPPALREAVEKWALRHGVTSSGGAVVAGLQALVLTTPAPPPLPPRRGLAVGVWR